MSDNPLPDKDKALFRYIMQTVKPLHATTTREPNASFTIRSNDPIEPPAPRPKDVLSDKPVISNYCLSNHHKTTVHSDTTLSYCSQHVPHKRLRQLRNGEIPWGARLDLHGLTPEIARDELCSFIEHKSRLGIRCLLVIHGKGSRHGEAPILKNSVNHWLQQLPQILAFHSAKAQHGGNGAVYVLLKRERPP